MDRLNLRTANSFFSKLTGLLGTKKLDNNAGLCILNCNFIHTFGMQYNLDVVFLNYDLEEQKYIKHLKPWRMAHCSKAKIVIELSAGYCDKNPNYLQHIKSALIQN